MVTSRTLAQLRRALKARGVTQARIAAACVPAVHPSMVSLVLAGKRPSERNVIRTAKLLAGWTDGQKNGVAV